MRCLCCDAELVEWSEFELLHCPRCGYTRRASFPDENPYATDEVWTEKFAALDQTPGARGLSAFRLGLLEVGGLPPEGRILDIGCSVGTFLALTREYGYRGVGIDCSPWAVDAAQQRGLNIGLSDADTDEFPQAVFDAVTMFDVLEHLREPADALRKARRALVDNDVGTILISTPNADIPRGEFRQWRHYYPNEHLNYFTERALWSLLERVGFFPWRTSALESAFRPYDRYPTRNILTVIARKEGRRE